MSPAVDDRASILEVLSRYTFALDARDWAQLESCFTEDASTDYGELGGTNANRAEIIQTCRAALDPIGVTQHLLGNTTVEIQGDEAVARSYMRVLHATEGIGSCVFYGIYEDRLVCTSAGWKIRHKRITPQWLEGQMSLLDGVPRGAAR